MRIPDLQSGRRSWVFGCNDILSGGHRASEVTEGYLKTWSEFGQVGENGHFNMLVLEDSRMLIPNAKPSAWVDGWTGALMNMWNRDFVRSNYQKQLNDVLVPGDDGAASVTLSEPPQTKGPVLDYDTGDFGWVSIWVSEMGDAATLSALTTHADRFMNPTWSKGGLFYPRQDQRFDAEGKLIRVEPITGNALLSYAALNVPDGMWALFNRPWGPEHFQEPLITALSDNVDVLKAVYDTVASDLQFILSLRADRSGPVSITIDNVFGCGRGEWVLTADGLVIASGGEDTTDSTPPILAVPQ